MRFLTRIGNLRGELFSSTFTFGLTAVIKLGSSLILTRLLSPDAYGVFGILFSFLFMIEMVSDLASGAFLIRHPRGNERIFVHTIWTVRLIRCSANFCITFLCAPIIAHIYQTPVLTGAFRMLSFWFLFAGLESMSFSLAQRNQRARISNYADLASNALMTVVVIILASVLKNQNALIYGALLQRALIMFASYLFYRDIGVGFAFDREALVEQFKFARFVLPSSILSIVLSQYDKVILLKLFNLSLLGVYTIASNMIGPITGVITHNARVVLYSRCSEYFRTDKLTAGARYYRENLRLRAVGVTLPALVAGFSQSIVAILYDARYAQVSIILMVMGLGAIVFAFQSASENLLVASGRTHAFLAANVIRLLSVIPATLLGYYLFGFDGFIWFNFLATLPLSIYFFYEQKRGGLLNLFDEGKLFAAAAAVFFLSLAASQLILAIIPTGWLHLGLKRH